MTMACLNQEEWNSTAPVMGMGPDGREGMQCLMQEMGGPEGMAAALGAGDENALPALFAAAAGCGLDMGGPPSQAPVAPTATPEPTATPTLEPSETPEHNLDRLRRRSRRPDLLDCGAVSPLPPKNAAQTTTLTTTTTPHQSNRASSRRKAASTAPTREGGSRASKRRTSSTSSPAPRPTTAASVPPVRQPGRSSHPTS